MRKGRTLGGKSGKKISPVERMRDGRGTAAIQEKAGQHKRAKRLEARVPEDWGKKGDSPMHPKILGSQKG